MPINKNIVVITQVGDEIHKDYKSGQDAYDYVEALKPAAKKLSHIQKEILRKLKDHVLL